MAASVFLSEDKAAWTQSTVGTEAHKEHGIRGTKMRKERKRERERERESEHDGKWHDDAECAIKYFYGAQGQGRRIVIERNNYFTRLSLELCALRVKYTCTCYGIESLTNIGDYPMSSLANFGDSGKFLA